MFGPMGMGSPGSFMPTGDSGAGGIDFAKLLPSLASRVKVGIGFGPNVAATMGGGGDNSQVMGMIKDLIEQMKKRTDTTNPTVNTNVASSPAIGGVPAPSLAGFQLPYTPFSATPWRR